MATAACRIVASRYESVCLSVGICPFVRMSVFRSYIVRRLTTLRESSWSLLSLGRIRTNFEKSDHLQQARQQHAYKHRLGRYIPRLIRIFFFFKMHFSLPPSLIGVACVWSRLRYDWLFSGPESWQMCFSPPLSLSPNVFDTVGYYTRTWARWNCSTWQQAAKWIAGVRQKINFLKILFAAAGKEGIPLCFSLRSRY